MFCRECFRRHGVKKALVPGQAMLPCWGNRRNDHSRGQTLYAVGSVLGQVLKCEECGHSVSFNGSLRMVLPEHHKGFVYSV